ncbi:MAG: hypothetical protein EOP45_18335 [Sphingobacteriaceae bacterium]|nr:MAG: hypothetical protein EOP45_18335 [Sphingobacteriaceae bacterium]
MGRAMTLIGNDEKSLVQRPKTGLVKNLTLTASITIDMHSQIQIIKDFIDKNVIQITDITNIKNIHKFVRVFINYAPLGFTKDPITIYNNLRAARFRGEIEKSVSFSFNYAEKEFFIFTEGGRTTRPYLTVTNNQLNFKKEMMDQVKTWNEFITKFPNVIEFLDKDEEQNMMLALYEADIIKARKVMDLPLVADPALLDKINRVNRYDNNAYPRYTHCEIHPSMCLGVISSNIPFPDHNQSPRGIFQYNQARQAMGLYISDYRHRTDISYILYHPQLPLSLNHQFQSCFYH